GGRFNYVFDTKDNSGVVNVQTDGKVEVYPNPASDKVFVQGITGRAYVVETGSGRVLASGACGDTGIDVSGLAPGIYLVKAGTTVHKFIKK
ncbi:MAG: T9SS type A sorting domain-containing protein, partial [Sodaliphilus sp.]|nr:T9SS type A sorting domain-containing protein [Sodaliphilus sp.]